ncbi:hypothetical protein GH975_09630 [Litorivicinus lipolyticus]|uniref:Long-chain fatty acid transport protein n=1 Tax=Litorivicinus lipolyticus TaxID=418701 RepID=A0A5Q2QCI0_9GAMM|nr:OmpP1/FadL family transporter [Litorivicinus lipolyticus]QGG80814.1 hypothetical protein GH975_09630 [Litorivicinus lipolyticus]
MRKRILAVAFAAITSASGAQAAGFYLKEQSVVGQGRAFAGSVAGTDGASSAYFNPAGAVGERNQIEFGVHIISPMAKVTDTGSNLAADTVNHTTNTQTPYSAKPVPNFHMTHQLSDDSAVALSVGAPFGFGNKYDSNFSGRLSNIEADLSVIELSGSYAKKVSNKTTISGGIVFQDLTVSQLQGASSNVAVNAKLKGESTDFGYVVGIKHELNDSTTIGASYRSQVTHVAKGTFGVVGGTQVNVEAPFQLPDIFALGVAHSVSDKTRAYADVTWYGWSAYKSSTIAVTADNTPLQAGTATAIGLPKTIQNNYSDTISFAIGAEHDYNDGYTLRAGLHLDPTPTNDQDRTLATPDGDRTWLSVGGSKVVNENLSLDAALTYILVEDGIVNQTAINTRAKAEGNVGILSLGLRYKF